MTETPDDVTTGELWRGFQEMKAAVAELTKALASLRTDLAKEVEAQVSERIKAQGERIGRLERLVYGAVGIILVAVLTAILAVVIVKPS
jgi:tetrahydromethanopterin S-methyltransferase subunit G